MIPFKQLNEEVLYATDAIVRVSRREIAELVARGEANPRKRVRLCTHKDVKDKLHEMLIIHTKDTYVRPHKHLGKCESLHVIQGVVDVVLFDDEGRVGEVVPMGEYGSGRVFYYRLCDSCFHTLRIISDHLVFHEVTNGPFDRAETIFAPWGPDDGDKPAVSRFMQKLIYLCQSQSSASHQEQG